MSWMSPNSCSLWPLALSSWIFCISYLVDRFIVTFLWRIRSSPRICMTGSLIRFDRSVSLYQASVLSIYLKVFLKSIRFLFISPEWLFSRMNSRQLSLILMLIFNFLCIIFIYLIFEFLINTNSWYTSSHSFLDWIC